MEDIAKPREYWFERQLWSYWPCHWKGWLIQIALFLVAFGAVDALRPFASSEPWMLALPILVMVTAMRVIGRRHSRKPWK